MKPLTLFLLLNSCLSIKIFTVTDQETKIRRLTVEYTDYYNVKKFVHQEWNLSKPIRYFFLYIYFRKKCRGKKKKYLMIHDKV